MSDLIAAIELSAKVRDDFAALAKCFGPYRAFEIMAAGVIQGCTNDDTERKFVEIVRAAYDDYVKANPAPAPDRERGQSE